MSTTDDELRRARRAATLRGALRRGPDEPDPTLMHPSRAQVETMAQAARALDQAVGRLTSIAADMAGLSLNSVLLQERIVIPAEGYAVRSFTVPVAFVAVANDAAHLVTVSESTPGASARTSGVGVFVVRPSTAKGFPLTGTDLTLFGTVGDAFDVAVLSRPMPPFTGPA